MMELSRENSSVSIVSFEHVNAGWARKLKSM